MVKHKMWCLVDKRTKKPIPIRCEDDIYAIGFEARRDLRKIMRMTAADMADGEPCKVEFEV